MGNIGFANSI